MSFKQEVLKTFAKERNHAIVFSPRLYYWYLGNRIYSKRKSHFSECVPPQYYGKTQLEIYKELHVSPRYSEETIYLPLYYLEIDPQSRIEVHRKRGIKKGESITVHKTPLGKLKQVESIGGGLGGHITEYPIKSLDDFKIMRYVLENTKFTFSKKNFELAEKQFEELCVTSTYLCKSPYQKLVTQLMGFTRTILFLKRYPSQLEDFMMYLEEWDDQMYDEISKSPLQIVNFGENLDANLSPPHYFEKYLIPYYERRVSHLHRAGKYCHIHIDGSIRDLLPYFKDLSFDGLEALTAEPQGDVSLEDIKGVIGDKILLDGLPSILFLPHYKTEFLEKYTVRVLKLFSPNLIIGVSDELSPNGDIRKIEKIAELIENYQS